MIPTDQILVCALIGEAARLAAEVGGHSYFRLPTPEEITDEWRDDALRMAKLNLQCLEWNRKAAIRDLELYESRKERLISLLTQVDAA